MRTNGDVFNILYIHSIICATVFTVNEQIGTKMKRQKTKNFYTPPQDPIRMMPKPDPDAKPLKKKYKFERGPRHNFWSLFEETK